MPIIDTHIPGLFVFEPKVFEDERGYFYESYNANIFAEKNINLNFVQDNQSKSSYGVLRGLHFQLEPMAQAKLVRVISGEVLDVAVDLRLGSPTYKEHYSIALSADNRKQLYIPKGFAHGFVVLSETAEFFYKCDNFYSKEHDGGIAFNDPTLNIDWQLPDDVLVISEKDKNLPLLNEATLNFKF
ncbi:MAG: dTDP-4-dehydrorhamnose 3,5-epimerase [Bacteroidetes bacterium]|nr:dTDP-4-dehydrorhamnose 3,5-epimerase [Bacteroidota bacterium]MBP7400042.1 dTDP-4-dehydrorhamnose 3,5-epimerase [Chitinophagales bacterium]MBK7109678.1 dTDP-4-dehydrorhamnose 3,5-epimerase [Bacteroidota bacterium]MBK8489251.1 dTDP-4-dehydrorhamnose 3,5-epimerase [Bacteroidota bacterium]MBK8682668.1 dTDP-4-dehydrorhamnose 3,5-epimerase [Bacteroidota bacterium]